MMKFNFKNSNDAIEYGKNASVEEVQYLREMREKYLEKFELYLSAESYDKASIEAAKAQFCREAVESSKHNK